ncbi:MAG: glycosyltransferase family 4 protein [Balneolaceae bacterium]
MEKKKLNILAAIPLSVGVINGGVRTQSRETMAFVEKMDGVSVQRFHPWEPTDLSQADIVHIFLAGPETSALAHHAANSSAKLVVSPVFYSRHSPGKLKTLLKGEQMARPLLTGYSSEYRVKADILRRADLILPNTSAEKELLMDAFELPDERLQVIPNGVNMHFADADAAPFIDATGLKNFTLFVGDLSARRKNVAALLRAYTPDNPPLVLIGRLDESDTANACRTLIEALPNAHYLGEYSPDDPMLASAYAAAAVFVLPSLFETPGIAAMEAALAGCAIAITAEGGTRDVFGNDAHYLDPADPPSMLAAIRQAHKAGPNATLKNRIATTFSWQQVAEQTVDAYQSLYG